MKKQNIFKLVFSIIIAQLAGIFGSIFTIPAVTTWYTTLEKPSFNPPDWIFTPVWITLFTLMGIALFLVWKKGLEKPGVKTAMMIFGIQLLLNAFWSVFFFGLQTPMYALIEILVLWVAIVWTITAFFNISRAASFLLMPYFLWVSFAMVLNFYIWQLNM